MLESSDPSSENEEFEELDINYKNIENIDEDSHYYEKLQDGYENIPSYRKEYFKKAINHPSFNFKMFQIKQTNFASRKRKETGVSKILTVSVTGSQTLVSDFFKLSLSKKKVE